MKKTYLALVISLLPMFAFAQVKDSVKYIAKIDSVVSIVPDGAGLDADTTKLAVEFTTGFEGNIVKLFVNGKLRFNMTAVTNYSIDVGAYTETDSIRAIKSLGVQIDNGPIVPVKIPKGGYVMEVAYQMKSGEVYIYFLDRHLFRD